MNKIIALAVEATLGALLDYAKYLEDTKQLNYQLLKDRVDSLIGMDYIKKSKGE